MATMDFPAGQVALVTGAGGGIGNATARRYAAAGVDVVLADVTDSVHTAAEEVRNEYPDRRIHSVVVDVTDEDSVQAMAEDVTKTFGRLDHLALVAGILNKAYKVEDMPFAEWRRVFSVNIDGQFLTSKAFIPLLRQDGGGTIVAISSYWAKRVRPEYAPYCSSKQAVIGFVQSLATELAPDIRVNAVLPGHIKTPMHLVALEKMAEDEGVTFEEQRQKEWGGIPMADAGTPEELADAVVYLSSPASSYIVGAALSVDGGISVQ